MRHAPRAQRRRPARRRTDRRLGPAPQRQVASARTDRRRRRRHRPRVRVDARGAEHQGDDHRGAPDDPRLRRPRDDRGAHVLHAPARRDLPPRREGRLGRLRRRRGASSPASRAARRSTATRCSTPSGGRRTPTSSNLPAAGLEADARGRIAVNEFFQTAVPHIYAAGDVIGFPALASTSMEQGRLASCHMFGAFCESRPHTIPYGIYTIPEISMVGKTEQELTEAKIPYEIGVAKFEELAKGQMLGVDAGLLKLLFDPKTPQAARRPRLRRARDGDHPHRPGGARVRRHDRLLPRHGLQLPDDGGGVQGGGARRT